MAQAAFYIQIYIYIYLSVACNSYLYTLEYWISRCRRLTTFRVVWRCSNRLALGSVAATDLLKKARVDIGQHNNYGLRNWFTLSPQSAVSLFGACPLRFVVRHWGFYLPDWRSEWRTGWLLIRLAQFVSDFSSFTGKRQFEFLWFIAAVWCIWLIASVTYTNSLKEFRPIELQWNSLLCYPKSVKGFDGFRKQM